MPPRRSTSVPPLVRPKAGEPAQTFVLDAAATAILADVSARAGISQASVLELALRRLAHDGARGGAVSRPSRAGVRESANQGQRLGVRLTPHAQYLLHELAEARPRYGDLRVEVVELAIRRFARFAERAGLLAPAE